MTESIRQLIECERKARERLDEALRSRDNIQAQARHDADIYIRDYMAEKEAEGAARDERDAAELAVLAEELEVLCRRTESEIAECSIDGVVDEIVGVVACSGRE